MTIQRMINWVEEHDVNNAERLWELLEHKLIMDGLEENPKSQSMTIQKMINWVEEHDVNNAERLWELLERQLTANELEENPKSQAITLQRMINWVEEHDVNNAERLWELLERKLTADELQENPKSQSMTIQRMINWVEEHDVNNAERLWALLERQLTVNEPKNHSRTLQRMINWVEKHDVNNAERLWGLLERKLSVGASTEELKIILRKIARFGQICPRPQGFNLHDELLDYQNNEPFDILFHISTLLILGETNSLCAFPSPAFDSTFVHRILKQMMALYCEDRFPSIEPIKECISLRIDDSNGVPNILSWGGAVHDFGLEFLRQCEQPIIIDGPNLFHTVDSKSLGPEVVAAWIREQNESVLIHLTLNSLIDFPDWIEYLHGGVDVVFLANMNPFLVEDLGMLLVSSITGGRILSNDKFRSERTSLVELIQPDVYERKIQFNVDENGILTENLQQEPSD